MYIYVYMYICICTYVYICVNMYICIFPYKHAYMYVYICIYIYIHSIYIYLYVCVYIYIYVYTYMYICIYMYIYLHTYVFIYLYIYMYIYANTYIYVNIYVYLHAYIYTASFYGLTRTLPWACTFTNTQDLRYFWKNDKMCRANTIGIYEYTFVSKSESLEIESHKVRGRKRTKERISTKFLLMTTSPPPPNHPIPIHTPHTCRAWGQGLTLRTVGIQAAFSVSVRDCESKFMQRRGGWYRLKGG